VNFRSRTKSYKSKKRIINSKTDWQIFENTHEAIISKEDFDLVQELRQIIPELSQFIEASEQKNADTAQFIGIVRKYSEIPKLTPEIMHEFIEKIVVYAPDKSSGHRTQQIDICFRFNVMTATVTADSVVYDKKRKAA